jgi:hypothetical protein
MKAKTKITKEQILVIERAARRIAEIENGLRINHKKVHKTAKDYNRQKFKKFDWAE